MCLVPGPHVRRAAAACLPLSLRSDLYHYEVITRASTRGKRTARHFVRYRRPTPAALPGTRHPRRHHQACIVRARVGGPPSRTQPGSRHSSMGRTFEVALDAFSAHRRFHAVSPRTKPDEPKPERRMEGEAVATRLDDLPGEVLLEVAKELTPTPESLLAAGCTTRSMHSLLIVNATELWEEAARIRFGSAAPSLARRSAASARGVASYKAAFELLAAVEGSIEIVDGTVTQHAAGVEVVACPCLETLHNYGVGAQGAIRFAAGSSFERALRGLERPLERLSATLVHGGKLAPAVAMVVTTPPHELQEHLWYNDGCDAIEAAISKRLHANLFSAMRQHGHASVAMPTLATGGAGLDVTCMCNGLAMALTEDVRQHPGALLHVRIACYEHSHLTPARAAKERLECLFDADFDATP